MVLSTAITHTLALLEGTPNSPYLSIALREAQERLDRADNQGCALNSHSRSIGGRDALHGAVSEVALAVSACVKDGSPQTARGILLWATPEALERQTAQIAQRLGRYCILGYLNEEPRTSDRHVLAMIAGALRVDAKSPPGTLGPTQEADALEALCAAETWQDVARDLHEKCADGNPLPFLRLLSKLTREGSLSRPAMNALLFCIRMIESPYLYQEVPTVVDWDSLIAKSVSDRRAFRAFWELQAVARDAPSIGRMIDRLLIESEPEQTLKKAIGDIPARSTRMIKVGYTNKGPTHRRLTTIVRDLTPFLDEGKTAGQILAKLEGDAEEDMSHNERCWSGGVQGWRRADLRKGLKELLNRFFRTPSLKQIGPGEAKAGETVAEALRNSLRDLRASGFSSIVASKNLESRLEDSVRRDGMGIIAYCELLVILNDYRYHFSRKGTHPTVIPILDTAIEVLLGLSFNAHHSHTEDRQNNFHPKDGTLTA